MTNTAVSSARLYWESKLAFFAPKGVDLPVGVSVFPDEIYAAPRSWAESAYPKLIHYNRLPKGGHFAAWEQPQMLSEELRRRFGPCASPRATRGGSDGEHRRPPVPFNVPQEALDDLRRRIAATRWPSRELVDDRSQGVQLATMQELARYWATEYDCGGSRRD